MSSEIVTEHSHLSDVHLTIDASHTDHHDEVISEKNASPQALLKQISSISPTLAVFVVAFILMFYGAYAIALYRRFDINIAISRRYILSPPLRAPPL